MSYVLLCTEYTAYCGLLASQILHKATIKGELQNRGCLAQNKGWLAQKRGWLAQNTGWLAQEQRILSTKTEDGKHKNGGWLTQKQRLVIIKTEDG